MEPRLDDWLTRIGRKPVPVLAKTIKDLRHQCQRDHSTVADLAAVVERDPGLAVFLLQLANSQTAGPLRSDVTSVQQALMMMGTDQLSELPDKLPVLETSLADTSRKQLLRCFSRAYHAARQAAHWAALRHDMSPDEVFAATQLHFLGEMFVAMYEPELLDRIVQVQVKDKIAAEEAQYIVLGFSFDQLTARLARLWRLPELVLEALHPENARYPRAYGIMLAVQLAREAAHDWYTPRMRQIEQDCADWLEQDLDDIIAGVHRLAVEIARAAGLYSVPPAAVTLPRVLVTEPLARQPPVTEPGHDAGICLMPQLAVLQDLLHQLKQADSKMPAYSLISLILKGMHDGIGLNRVVFARLDHDDQILRAEKIIGADNDPHFSRFEISLRQPHLFSRLAKRQQAVLINDASRSKFWSLVPEEFQKLIGINSFLAMSVHIEGKPFGLFYGDRHSNNCQIDDKSYQYFKTICTVGTQALQKLDKIDFSRQ